MSNPGDLVRRTGTTRQEETSMKYMLLIYTDPSAFDPAQGEKIYGEYMAFTQEIVDSGELVAGDPLEGTETATSVRVRDGKRTTTDGPFAETKEVLGGYYIVDVKDLDRPSSWRRRSPTPAPAASRSAPSWTWADDLDVRAPVPARVGAGARVAHPNARRLRRRRGRAARGGRRRARTVAARRRARPSRGVAAHDGPTQGDRSASSRSQAG